MSRRKLDQVAKWRSTADCDARAGAPVGKALNEAADEVERLRYELYASVTDRERLNDMVVAVIERNQELLKRAELAEEKLAEARKDAEAGWADAEKRQKETEEWAQTARRFHEEWKAAEKALKEVRRVKVVKA